MRRRALERIEQRRLSGKPPARIFAYVYSRRRWGGGEEPFHSGPGSHDPDVVAPYVEAVRSFAAGFDPPLDAVDIGCGDFNVGARLRSAFGEYIACDVVPELIAFNRAKYAGMDVRFRVVDAVSDPLPAGSVAILKQVLQHLSNDHISQVLAKLESFSHAIVTEHLPADEVFIPNRDQPTGSGIRLNASPAGGVVVTEPPFGLAVRSQRTLCTLPHMSGLLTTTLYEIGTGSLSRPPRGAR